MLAERGRGRKRDTQRVGDHNDSAEELKHPEVCRRHYAHTLLLLAATLVHARNSNLTHVRQLVFVRFTQSQSSQVSGLSFLSGGLKMLSSTSKSIFNSFRAPSPLLDEKVFEVSRSKPTPM